MFRIKICGVTNLDDAANAVRAGADAIGLNFYSQSSRYVAPELAAKISCGLPMGAAKVGVFVNETTSNMQNIAAQTHLDFIQLHGNEPAEQVIELSPFPVILAIRQGELPLVQLQSYLKQCRRSDAQPAALLLDAGSPGIYGGSGKLANWDKIREIKPQLDGIKIVLAGGLHPSNIASAIRQVRPAAVDVASGVESSPGRKSLDLMQKFVQQARLAWESVDQD